MATLLEMTLKYSKIRLVNHPLAHGSDQQSCVLPINQN